MRKVNSLWKIILLLLCIAATLPAQTLDDAKKRYQDGQYQAAGDLFYTLYAFDEAIEAYQKQQQVYIKKKQTKEADALNPLIQRAERAARMLTYCEDIQIIDSIIIDKKNFLEAYRISRETGFLSWEESEIVYENPLKDKRYFAKPNENGRLRLFNEWKIQGEWIDEKTLPLPYDSLENAAYPFVFQDGVTIYYASDGHGSIGGYDLFMTRYNSNNDTYLAPAQMGMPFNSPANDYLMVVDENLGIGYFASDRFQKEDQVAVYTFIPNE
ncbi:MAG: hypothetical protein LBN18_02400, partial [Dysgonamonadaceae bacterium]|nr:hypothetical protein [Dysgonamonadaceae bacterium]